MENLNVKEYENRLDILKKLNEAIMSNDYVKIKKLSNRTIHSASANQDTDSISLAVIVYALSKILEREKYRSYPQWNEFYSKIRDVIEEAYKRYKEKDFDGFRNALFKISGSIKKIKGNLRRYLEQVFRNAKINKGSRIYEHGISFSQTASIMGISVWELAEYIGQTRIADVDMSITKEIEERISYIKNLFYE